MDRVGFFCAYLCLTMLLCVLLCQNRDFDTMNRLKTAILTR